MDAPSAEVLRTELRSAGLRATQPRVQVLGLLKEIGGHHSVDNMVDLLSQRGCRLPRASVYGIVHALVDHGLLFLADTGPGRAVYEVISEPHHHLVCTECGTIEDVPCVAHGQCVDTPGLGDRVKQAQIILRGLCLQCAS